MAVLICSNLLHLHQSLLCSTVKPSNLTVPVTAAVVVLALILIGAAGFIVYKKKKGEKEDFRTLILVFKFQLKNVNKHQLPALHNLKPQ